MKEVVQQLLSDRVMRVVFYASVIVGIVFGVLILRENVRGAEIAAIVVPTIVVALIYICAALMWLARFESEGWKRLAVPLYLVAFGICLYLFRPRWGWAGATLEAFFYECFIPTVITMGAVALGYLALIRLGRWLIEGFTKQQSP